MTNRNGSSTAVLDLSSISSLDLLPRGLDRVVCLFQASPQRLETIQTRFPAAKVVVAAPSCEGSWQAAVQRDFDALASLDPVHDGVPVLDCFRAAIRDELAFLRALEWGLGGCGRVFAVAGTPLTAVLDRVRAAGGIGEVSLFGDPASVRPGLMSKLRRAGVRGTATALASRLDPSGARRARLRPRLTLDPAATVLVSSYANATRAALEAHAAAGGGDGILLASGPGAASGLVLPDGVRRVSLAAASTLDTTDTGAHRSAIVPSALTALDAWGERGDPWAPGPVLRATRLGRALPTTHLPELAGSIGSIRRVLLATRARRLIVGDEFSFVDRAALHVARALGLETISRQHGVLDSHYIRDRVLADRYLAWDASTIEWLARQGALGDRRAEVLPRSLAVLAPRATQARHVVVFLQPFQLIGISPRDWLLETIPVVVLAASAAGLVPVLKPHPLQSVAEIKDDLRGGLDRACRIVTNRSARELLAEAAVAVTLDSSVAVDCREAGIPCLSTGWYAGTYRADLARLGYFETATTPEALAAALARLLPPGRRR